MRELKIERKFNFFISQHKFIYTFREGGGGIRREGHIGETGRGGEGWKLRESDRDGQAETELKTDNTLYVANGPIHS